MADFEQAVLKTLLNEGGFVNNSSDPGGATKYGITQADMPDVDISKITPHQAIDYYQEHYWKPFYNDIENQFIGEKIFDMGVLFGIGEAVKLLQLTLQIKNDGLFGPVTLQEVNDSDSVSLLLGYKSTLVQHTLGIGSAKPNERIFVSGWIKRINS